MNSTTETTSKLVAGDEIRITNCDPYEKYVNGDILTVVRVMESNSGVDAEMSNGHEVYVSNREFEVVVPALPKRIKVTESNHPQEYMVGDVLELSPDQGWCSRGEVRVLNKHGYNSVVFKGQWEEVCVSELFVVGDKAELTEDYCKRPAGYQFVVESVNNRQNSPLLVGKGLDDGVHIGVYASRCKLVEAPAVPEFKIGDMVETTEENSEFSYSAGVRGKVTALDCDEPKIFVDTIGYVHTDDLKMVEPETGNEIKVGDRVRILSDAELPYLKKGDVGVVVSIQAGTRPIKIQQDAPYTRSNGRWWTSSNNLEILSSEPTSHIRVLKSDHPREYVIGDILEVRIDGNPSKGNMHVLNKHGGTSVVFAGGWEYCEAPEVEQEPLAEWEKELLGTTPRKIDFENIQEGDLIKAEYTYGGVKRTAEGVAGRHYARSGGLWSTAEDSPVADNIWNATYTLLERPEPEPETNPFEEARVGSVAKEGENYLWIKEAENTWRAYNVNGSYRSSVHKTNERMLSFSKALGIVRLTLSV